MKKILSVIVVLVCVLAFPVTAFAATSPGGGAATSPVPPAVTEEYVIEDLAKGVTVNGQQVVPVASDLVQARSFLAAGAYSDTELAAFATGIDDVRTAWVAGGTADFDSLPITTKRDIRDISTATLATVGATITYNGNNSISINAPSISFNSAGGWTIVNLGGGGGGGQPSPVKQTGADYSLSLLICMVLLVVLVSTFIVARRKGLFER